MLLLYYYNHDEEGHYTNSGWVLGETRETLEQYAKEHNIADYGITVNERTYEGMEMTIEKLNAKIESAKSFIDKL